MTHKLYLGYQMFPSVYVQFIHLLAYTIQGRKEVQYYVVFFSVF
jgi:hypothetical protein